MARMRAVDGTGGIKGQVASLKRDGILDAATRLFVRRGYHGSSMEAIADAIGVTKPFIYYQFRDKAEILAAICRQGADLTLSAVGDAEVLAGSHEARLTWFCARLAQIVIRYQGFLMVYMREVGNLAEDDRHAIVSVRDEIDRRVAALIGAGAKAGEFEVIDALIAARAITGMLSYIYMWHRDADVMADDELGRTMASIAMRTLLPSVRGTLPAPRTKRSVAAAGRK